MPDYALLLSAQAGDVYHSDITKTALGWERSVRLQGGFWQGSFRIEDELSVLQDWFYNRLGWQVQERAGGGITWEGLIYEVALNANGVTRRRSLDALSNELIWTRHQPGRLRNEESIVRYGTKQIYMDGPYLPGEGPTTELAKSAWPWARAIGIAPSDAEATLEVTVCGYIYTLNWRYAYANWTNPGMYWTASEWITDELTRNRGDYLIQGRIAENTLPVQKFQVDTVRVWDLLQDLVKLGDANAQPWRLWVSPGRWINYGPVDLTVRGYLRGGQLYTTVGGLANLTPRTVQPGVIRDVAYPQGRAEPGSILSDTRDVLVEEVSVDAEGRLSLRTEFTTDNDLLAAQAERRSADDSRLREQLGREWEADYEKRRKRWETQYPGVPFDPTKDQH